MIPTIVEATTLSDAWFQLLWQLTKGNAPHSTYTIDKGSYVGQKRLEFDFVLVTIKNPGARPLIPDIPPGLAIPPPVESMEYVENYFTRYLMDTELEPNETYKYATWLVPGVERVIEQLKGAPGNNQAAISLGGYMPFFNTWEGLAGRLDVRDTDNEIDPATGQRDPACLRVVDFRLDQKNVLHMFIYFRSWDLWGGFPANLAALQILKEFVAQEIDAEDGSMICASKGLHLYSHAIQVAAKRCNIDNVDTLDDLLAAWSK